MSAIVRVASDVRVELQDRVLRYEVEEAFLNRGNLVGEADYFFPLPKGAAFQDLKLEIGGELVAGETMNAEQARKIYEEIVRRQRDPALVEWMGYGLLRARIFPIAPGERKRVVVRFHSVAEREGDALRVDYFRGSDPSRGVAVNVSDRGDVRRDDRDRGRNSFTLTYPANEAIGEPYSPTHSLDVDRMAGGRRRVHVRGDARDVTLLLPVRRSNDPSISVLAHASGGDDGFALITLSPPRALPRSLPRDVTIVLDASGSMSGKKIQQARAAGRQVLGTLRPEDRFRIIDFSTDVRTFRDEFVSASQANVRDAERYLAEIDAEGSTNISGALEEALRVTSPPHESRMAVVLFVTDGAPTVGERSPEAIADRARELRGTRRIFTFGVGADLNVSLIEQLALQGRGTAHFVRPEESVEHAVGVVASRLTSPVVTNVRVRAEGVRLSKLLPAGPVDVFAGQDLVMLGRYDGSGRARILFDGETASGHVRWSEEVTLPERARENSFIPRLWATQRIGHLSAEKRRNGGSTEIDDEIRTLGERYGIPTEFSSYLVLEPGMVADRDVSGASAGVRRREIGRPGRVNAAAPQSAQTRTFEAAKQAAEQRAVSTLAAADEVSRMDASSGATLRRAGDRAFVSRNGVWVDTRHKEGMTIIRIKPYSTAYFRILDAVPELRAAFALDDRVLVAGRTLSVETSDDGKETLTEAEMEEIRRGY